MANMANMAWIENEFNEMKCPQTDNHIFNQIRTNGTEIVYLLNSAKAKIVDKATKNDPAFITAISHEVSTLDTLKQKILFMYSLFILAMPTVLQVFVDNGVKIMPYHLFMVLSCSSFEFDNSIRFHSFQYFRRIRVRVDVVKFLLSHISFDSREIIKNTLKTRLDIFTIFYSNTDLVSILVEENVIPPLNINDVRRLFLTYIMNGRLTENILHCLIKFGLPVNDKIGYPMHFAIESNQKNIFQLLLTNGWSLNIIDENGNSPLHYASLYGKYQFVQTILRFIVKIT